MQNEITKPSNLLNKDGFMVQKGWARKPILKYNRERIGFQWYRIKEWDHYSVLDKEQGFGFQMTLGDIGYLTLIGFNWLDFKNKKKALGGSIRFLTRGKNTFDRSSLDKNDIKLPGRGYNATIYHRKAKRILTVNYPRFGFKGLKGKVILHDDPKMDNTVVATGYKEDPRLFYYNHKVNYMPAEGSITFGKKTFQLNPSSSFGLMDWGRGVWPYRTHWLWGSACGLVNGVPLAFNIGYGFGDLSTHTENIVFYNGKANKLDKVIFHNPNRDSYKPWRFTSNDNRFTMTLKPLISDKSKLDLGFLLTDTALMHGYYTGEVVLDNGEKIRVENMMGHAEDIKWRW